MKKYALLWVGLSVFALASYSFTSAGPKTQQLIHVGETFPDVALDALESPEDRHYLGLDSGEAFTIRDIQADLVLVEILNIHCVHCKEQAPIYNNLFELIEADSSLHGRIKMIGVGVGNSQGEVKYFRGRYEIPFPIVPDRRFVLHKALGGPSTPFTVLVRLEEDSGTATVARTHLGVNEEYEEMYQDMQALMTLHPTVLRESGRKTEAKVITVEPPLPQSELVARIKEAMAEVGGGDLAEFSEVALEDSQVFTGAIEGEDGVKRLFAEVVGRPTVCDVCHDVHFFYIFNEKGKVLEFVPLLVTKWGNEEWSEEDVQFMRDRLVGRYLFRPFEFEPAVDAVTSATISSVVIFDAMSQGKELFESLKQKGFIS